MLETLDDSANENRVRTSEESEKSSTSFEGPPTLAFIFAAALIFVSFGFGHYGSMTGFTACTYLAVAVFTIGFFWRLRRRPWFWGTFAGIALFHIPLVAFAPLSQWWLHQKGVAFVDFADFAVYCLVVIGVEKFIRNLSKDSETGDA